MVCQQYKITARVEAGSTKEYNEHGMHACYVKTYGNFDHLPVSMTVFSDQSVIFN